MNRRGFLAAAFGCSVAKAAPEFIAHPTLTFADGSPVYVGMEIDATWFVMPAEADGFQGVGISSVFYDDYEEWPPAHS